MERRRTGPEAGKLFWQQACLELAQQCFGSHAAGRIPGHQVQEDVRQEVLEGRLRTAPAGVAQHKEYAEQCARLARGAPKQM